MEGTGTELLEDIETTTSRLAISPGSSQALSFHLPAWRLRGGVGSDGWNRITDFGVMNPELPSTVTYKNPQMG